MKEFEYYSPTKVIFGVGALQKIGEEAKKFSHDVMLVADPFTRSSGLLDNVKKIITKAGCSCVAVFDDVEPEPYSEKIMDQSKICREMGAKVIIAIGGGSTIDTGKGIAVAATHPGDVLDYAVHKNNEITEKTLPVIAIPTTAGTGSEMNLAAVIQNRKERSKNVLRSPHISAKLAIVDPDLSSSMPKELTVNTGMDALCQSVEAYISTNAGPITDGLCLESISLIGKGFRRAVNNPTDIDARGYMAIAANMSGIAIGNAFVGAVHAIAMVLGAYFHLPHGLAIAIIFPYVLEFNLTGNSARYADIARAWGIDVCGMNEVKAAQSFIDDIYKLISDFKVAKKLHEFGINKSEFLSIGKDACVHPDMLTNPRDITPEDIVTILEKAY